MKPPTDQQIASSYQPLFDLMQDEHGLILLESEMDEIILAARQVVKNVDGLNA